MTVHVIGGGLAGLSAAIAVAGRGERVILSEAARHAGGRCRSYHDGLLDMTIDNGNHLVLSGNVAVDRYLRDIGAEGRVTGPDRPEFHFFDFQLGDRWTLRPDDGPVPWWIFHADRRVPGTRLIDYLALLVLMRRHPGRRIDEVVRRDTVLWEKFLRPVLLSALNTAPEAASADLAGAIVRETFAKGGRHMRPLISSPNLAAAFIDPAIDRLRRHGADIRLGRSLRAVRFADGRAAALAFDGEEEAVQPDDRVIVAVPPWTAEKLLPGVTAPQTFRAILNAHFQIVPPPQALAMVGVIGGTAEWVFAFEDRLSVTVSAADHLMDIDTDRPDPALVARCRRGPRPDGTGAALPDRQGEAGHLRRDAGRGCTAAAGADRVGQPVPRRRLDRHRPAGDDRGRAAVGQHGAAALALGGA